MTKKITHFLIILISCMSIGQSTALSQSTEEILLKLKKMEAEIAELKDALKKKDTETPAHVEKTPSTVNKTADINEDMFKPQSQTAAVAPTPQAPATTQAVASPQDLGQFGITYRSDGYKFDTLRFGAYGESIFGGENTGDDWQNGFDANRVVLLGTYQISDNIFFNTEIEFEHGGIAKDADDKLSGAIEVEQVFIDFRVNDYFTWRSPGVDVIPIGYVNLFHEPTQFYSTKRPELYDGLIPATWFAPSTGAYGKIVDGLYYQAQISSSLEDSVNAGSSEDDPDNYDAGISGSDALSLARAPIGDRSQQGDNLAYTARLSYTPGVIPGLSGSTSFYYTDDTNPRNAFGTNANGSKRNLGSSELNIFDTEVRYRIPKTGVELRSEYVQVNFGDPDNLKANNDINPTNNVGDSMNGYSLEAAFHHDLQPDAKDHWELVPFYRFSSIRLQNSGVQGSDANDPTGAGSKKFHTFGASLFPTPKVVIKADYQITMDDDNQTSNTRSLLGAVGFFF